MGYRISLSNANSIGHLIEGNIISFLNQTFLDRNYFNGNIKYIDDFLSERNVDFISANWPRYLTIKSKLRSEWYDVKNLMHDIRNQRNNQSESISINNLSYNEEILLFFKQVSELLGGYKYRYLLLPGFEDSELNRLMINRQELLQLLAIDTNSSYLILQLKDLPEKNDVLILDSFNHFNKAIKRIYEWPAILIWEKDKSDGIFIPINNIDEVKTIIGAQNYEQNYFVHLHETYGKRRTKSISQFIHLSDLHLGLSGQESKTLRLIEIIKKHRRITDPSIKMYPIISGDLVDTPSVKNVRLYELFESQLESIGLESPITVLGNHDLFLKGFLRFWQKGKNILTSLASRELVTVHDDMKLLIIRFNSNVDGKWAQGKIGLDQLANVGNQLDRLIDKDDYFKIAILHHHPFEMESPDWMKETWYESILGKLSFDINSSNILIDSDVFINWLSARGINFILHGHKHIPKIFNKDGFNIVAAGSSTGNIDHSIKDKTFLTYNLITYDLDKFKPISSTIVFEDLIGSGTKNYQAEIY